MKPKKKRNSRKIKDAHIDYSDIPELTDEQLKKFKRVRRPLIRLQKHKKVTKKSMVINGIELFSHDPSKIFKNHNEIEQALFEAFMDVYKEAFMDILSGYVRSNNILGQCRRTGLSRTMVYEAISDDRNPSLDTLFKIMTSLKKAA